MGECDGHYPAPTVDLAGPRARCLLASATTTASGSDSGPRCALIRSAMDAHHAQRRTVTFGTGTTSSASSTSRNAGYSGSLTIFAGQWVRGAARLVEDTSPTRGVNVLGLAAVRREHHRPSESSSSLEWEHSISCGRSRPRPRLLPRWRESTHPVRASS